MRLYVRYNKNNNYNKRNKINFLVVSIILKKVNRSLITKLSYELVL